MNIPSSLFWIMQQETKQNQRVGPTVKTPFVQVEDYVHGAGHP